MCASFIVRVHACVRAKQWYQLGVRVPMTGLQQVDLSLEVHLHLRGADPVVRVA